MDTNDVEFLCIQHILNASDVEEQAKFLTEVRLSDLNYPLSRQIYTFVSEIVSKGFLCDFMTVMMSGIFERDQVIDYYVGNDSMYMGSYSASLHFEMLKNKSYKQNLLNTLSKWSKEIEQIPLTEDFINSRESVIADLSKLPMQQKMNFANLDNNKALLMENIKKNNKNIDGYSWGIEELDLVTNGILTKRLYVLGALKKSGKSRFVMFTINNLVKQKAKCAFISLEMPQYEVVKVLISTATGIPDFRMRSMNLLTKQQMAVLESYKMPNDLFTLDCCSVDKVDLVNKIRFFAKTGHKIIFVDYLQRVKHNKAKQAQELEDISNTIADCTREFDVGIILLSQLSNDGETANEPTIGLLKGSGGIGESGDTIMLLDNVYRRTKQEGNRGMFSLMLEQRYGMSTKIAFTGDLDISRFFGYMPKKELDESDEKRKENEIPFENIGEKLDMDNIASLFTK